MSVEIKPTVKSFVETIHPINTDKLYVYLDSKIYPNEFGISVRPLLVKYGSTVIDMSKMIDMFGKVPYITVKENRFRSVYRDPMLMTIDLKPKQYKDNNYYQYFIDKLCLQSELKRYEVIYNKAHKVISEYKQTITKSQSVDDFREIDKDDDTMYSAKADEPI